MSTKDLIREKLNELSKEDLINIITELVSIYIDGVVNTKMYNVNCLQQCFKNNITDIEMSFNNMCHQIDYNFCNKKK